MRICLIAGLSLLLLSGCASNYKSLTPDRTYYQSSSTDNGVEFSYKLGVLREHGNKKYAKREDKKAIRIASVRITNNGANDITIGKNVYFFSGNSEAYLIEPSLLHKELKQGVPEYLLFLLLTPMTLNNGDDSTPIGIAVGPGLAIGNMAAAGAANKKFLQELQKFDLVNKTIKPGETVYGLIGIRDTGYNPIFLKFRTDVTTD
jgi:hypothetical protein